MPRTTAVQSVWSRFQLEASSLFSLLQSARVSTREQLSPIHNTPACAGALRGPVTHVLDRPRLGETYRRMLQERREKVLSSKRKRTRDYSRHSWAKTLNFHRSCEIFRKSIRSVNYERIKAYFTFLFCVFFLSVIKGFAWWFDCLMLRILVHLILLQWNTIFLRWFSVINI